MMHAAAVVMEGELNAHEIAVRLRGLLGARQSQSLEPVATRLGVSATALTLCLDEITPRPTMSVLAAVVREYAVDPSWLLFGQYDSVVHHAAMDEGQYSTPSSLAALATRRSLDGVVSQSPLAIDP